MREGTFFIASVSLAMTGPGVGRGGLGLIAGGGQAE